MRAFRLLCAALATLACTAQADPSGFYMGISAGAETFKAKVGTGVREKPTRHNVINNLSDDEMGGIFGVYIGYGKMYPRASRGVGFDRTGYLAGEIEVSVGDTSLIADATARITPTSATTPDERLSVQGVRAGSLDLDREVIISGSLLLGAEMGRGIFYLKAGMASLNAEHVGFRLGVGYMRPLSRPWAWRAEYVHSAFSGGDNETFDKAYSGAFQLGLTRYFP